jgi:enolase
VANVNGAICEALVGHESLDQTGIDRAMIELDGTETKSKLGANAILGVSMAVAHAAANELDLPLFRYIGGTNAKVLPVPMMNIMNGGAHSDAPIDIQEFMIIPKGASSFSEGLRMGTEIFHALKSVLKKAGLSTAVGDEGGFAPVLKGNEHAIEVIWKPSQGRLQGRQGHLPGPGRGQQRVLRQGRRSTCSRSPTSPSAPPSRWSFYWAKLGQEVPDHQHRGRLRRGDWAGWKLLTDAAGRQVPAGGRRPVRDQHQVPAARHPTTGTANSILVKVNQIGTLTETLDAVHRGSAMAIARQIHRGHQPSLGRDRGRHHRRHRWWPPMRARSRPAP